MFSRTCKIAGCVASQELWSRKILDLRAPLLSPRDSKSFLKFIQKQVLPKVQELVLPIRFSEPREYLLATLKQFPGLFMVPLQIHELNIHVAEYIQLFPKLKIVHSPDRTLSDLLDLCRSSGIDSSLEGLTGKMCSKQLKLEASFCFFPKLSMLRLIVESGSTNLYNYVDDYCSTRGIVNCTLILNVVDKVPVLNLTRIRNSCQKNQVTFGIEIVLFNSDDGLLDSFRDNVFAISLTTGQNEYVEYEDGYDDDFWATGFRNLRALRYYSLSSDFSSFWPSVSANPPVGLTDLDCMIFDNDIDQLCRFIANDATSIENAKITVQYAGMQTADRAFFSSIASRTSPMRSLKIYFGQPFHSIIIVFWFFLKNQLNCAPLDAFEYSNLYSIPCFLLPVVLGLSRGLKKLVIGFENSTQTEKMVLTGISNYVKREICLREFQYEIYSNGSSECGLLVNGIFRSFSTSRPALLDKGYVSGNLLATRIADVRFQHAMENAVKKYNVFIARLRTILIGENARRLQNADDFDFRHKPTEGHKLAENLLEMARRRILCKISLYISGTAVLVGDGGSSTELYTAS
ncbi:hypothetical protein HDE_00867 [Halotydeus destructor]|nr:hypothetical protein HDE_00867 [Halotydeus destructor]